jgi:PAS domain S-box-containing protein
MLAVSVWSLAVTLMALSRTDAAALFWDNISYLGVTCVPVTFLIFVIQYTGRDQWLTPLRLALLLIMPFITQVLIWTNKSHGLFLRQLSYYRPGALTFWDDWLPGPGFWLHTAYSYVLILLGVLLLVQAVVQSSGVYRVQAAILLSGLLPPIAINILETFEVVVEPVPEMTLLGFTVMGIIFAWALFRHRLLDLVPVARGTLIDTMSDGMIVLDGQDRIVDFNPAMESFLNIPLNRAIGQPANRIFHTWPDLTTCLQNTGESQVEISRDRDGANYYYDLRISPLTNKRRRLTGRMLVLRDITGRVRAEQALQKVRDEEAIAEERRRIAREIHDGLAQNLASLRMRASLWQALLAQDPAKMHAELDQMSALLSASIQDVRRSIFALRPIGLEELAFYPALQRFTNDFGEQNQLHVDLHILGSTDKLPASLEPVLFRIIQESMHNVSKHAQANTVWISLDLETDNSVTLQIRDDGLGFDLSCLSRLVREGHLGLHQMRERVENLQGTFLLHSQPNHGTEIKIVLPLPGT